jgi:rod shape determining protein RodA
VFPTMRGVSFVTWLRDVDWLMVGSALSLSIVGVMTMSSYGESESYFSSNQIVWIGISLATMLVLSRLDFRFLRRTSVVLALLGVSTITLVLVLFLGETVLGARSRFDFGFFALQPADPIKLVLIIVLAKYFSRRHIEIRNIRHIIVSGLYTGLLAGLVFIQPDFGSAIIMGCVWLVMILVSGLSKRHLLFVFLVGAVFLGGLWFFGFEDYQKERILTFLNPLTDLQGTGYNAFQSTVAVGSGEFLGKGVGYGTQSKLQFLPEYETDFIFAAFAEEWGFMGVILLFALFAMLIFRILQHALHGASNFEVLFGIGLTALFMSHIVVHVGMNIGLLPVTGTTIPFLSYGGSHLVTEFAGLGILLGMSRYGRKAHRDETVKEFLGASEI